MENNKRIWCFAPWYNMLLAMDSNTVSVVPCCYFENTFAKLESMPQTEKEVMQIYNSNSFVELRKRLVTGEVSGLPCGERCYERLLNNIKWGTSCQMDKELPKLSFNSSDDYISFHAHANESYQAGKTIVEHPPLSYHFSLSKRCNLRCIMCLQDHNDPFLAPIASITELLCNQGFNRIDQVGVIGGEPFFAKDSLELIHYLANEEIFGTNVYITTNGTLLKHEIQTLLSLRNLKLTISMDGGDKQTYEFIRGGSWENIVENLQILTRKDVYNPDWDISINCCVMKSNICHLDKLVDLAHDLSFNLTFSAIAGVSNETENILLYNYLLDDLPDWEIRFENALEKARQYGMDKTVVWLELLHKLLTIHPKITREAMTDFWEYGWKAIKGMAYPRLHKIYLAKMNVEQQPLDTQYIENLMFPSKWKLILRCRLGSLREPLVHAFPILGKAEKMISKLVQRFLKI